MRKFLRVISILITTGIAVAFLFSCFTPYISPVGFWPMAFFALAFPYLTCNLVFVAFSWLFVKKRVGYGLLFLLLMGTENLFATLAIHAGTNSQIPPKQPDALRILSWNVRSFDNPAVHADSVSSIRRLMFDYIKQSNADILCLQEFSEYIGPAFLSNTQQLREFGYTYQYKSNEIDKSYGWGAVKTGTAIFSKIPIADTGKTLLGDPSFPEHIIYGDVSFQGKTLRLFSTHFKSLNLFTTTGNSSGVVFHNNSEIIYKASKFEKLRIFAQDHVKEALIAKIALNNSPYPLVFTADMNSVPTSYPYHLMSAGLTDAFLKKGCGLGTTIDNLPKTLRIDYVFVGQQFSIRHYQKDEVHLSDHFPQIVDLVWKQ